MRTGQNDSKFGLGLASGAAGEAVARLRRAGSPVELVGVHAHIGSQIFSVSSFVRAVEVLAEFFVPLELGELCIGGGLGVAYMEGERAPSISEWGAAVRHACAVAGVPGSVRITAEPGRAVVASAAITFYSVGTIKHLPGLGDCPKRGRARETLNISTAFTEAHVTADGKLSACSFDASPKWAMGDLTWQPFMEAWNSLHFMKLREAHLMKDVRDTQCERCIAFG